MPSPPSPPSPLQKLLALPPITETLRDNRLVAKKSLGQHFLPDLNLAAKIVTLAPLHQAQAVIEIGPGPGGLTRMLLAELLRLESKSPLIAIENDQRCLKALQPLKEIVGENLHLIAASAEKVDFAAILPQQKHASIVVANLPYNVATPILLKLLAQSHRFSQLILMFQAEMAQRICALPNSKEYGRLSVAVQFLCSAEISMRILPQAFTPPPKVDSAIVRLCPHGDAQRISLWPALQEVIRAAFSERRKMLRKSLQNLPTRANKPANKTAEQLLQAAEIDGHRRAETLTVAEFTHLATIYQTCQYAQ